MLFCKCFFAPRLILRLSFILITLLLFIILMHCPRSLCFTQSRLGMWYDQQHKKKQRATFINNKHFFKDPQIILFYTYLPKSRLFRINRSIFVWSSKNEYNTPLDTEGVHIYIYAHRWRHRVVQHLCYSFLVAPHSLASCELKSRSYFEIYCEYNPVANPMPKHNEHNPF